MSEGKCFEWMKQKRKSQQHQQKMWKCLVKTFKKSNITEIEKIQLKTLHGEVG